MPSVLRHGNYILLQIRGDPVLRWGGDFSVRDVVHIDDGLNIHNPSQWDAEYITAQRYC
jgi:hypothetical protein